MSSLLVQKLQWLDEEIQKYSCCSQGICPCDGSCLCEECECPFSDVIRNRVETLIQARLALSQKIAEAEYTYTTSEQAILDEVQSLIGRVPSLKSDIVRRTLFFSGYPVQGSNQQKILFSNSF